ncbi:contact-dependent growth inhibition system immunity protein [Amantichitinum ursilacus]|uniref:CdiI immunity protein domain-containing protein n=1 Tax=Amantichitinum ursilacus TaxID=857265 RepID=A0A0N0XKM8_9NEIS|nr:contact-dependent growth inhibition system immunity protein [Amantichitinum ursilacus]KPC52528.1 hypothetical protein WG78_11805 [Amantichitinum ursilacus]
MTYQNIEALGQLLGCYFHQDWTDEFDSDEAAFQVIVDSEPKERLLAGVKEIDALLAASLPEDELRSLMAESAGCYFDPGSEGLTYEQWLKRARQKFAQA